MSDVKLDSSFTTRCLIFILGLLFIVYGTAVLGVQHASPIGTSFTGIFSTALPAVQIITGFFLLITLTYEPCGGSLIISSLVLLTVLLVTTVSCCIYFTTAHDIWREVSIQAQPLLEGHYYHAVYHYRSHTSSPVAMPRAL